MSPRGEMPDEEGFLTRWSRRKTEIAREEVAAPAPSAALPAESAAAEVPEPEMVEPPSLDLVDKDFDVAHWLTQNVPESWKLAALRRAWESDPAIRDFENPARDYALDWNTPGGAPGYGPLSESDDVEAMVRGIFGDPPTSAEELQLVAEATGEGTTPRLSSKEDVPPSDAAVRESSSAASLPLPIRRTDSGDDARAEGPIAQKSADRVYAAVQNNPAPEGLPLRLRRRGGGAVPD